MLHPGEKIVIILRRHWIAFLSNAILVSFMILTLAAFVAISNAVRYHISYSEIWGIVGTRFNVLEAIVLWMTFLALIAYGSLIAGSRVLESAFCSHALALWKRHRIVVLGFVSGLIVLALIFAVAVFINDEIDTKIAQNIIPIQSKNISENIGQGLILVVGSMYALSIIGYFFISWLDYYLDVFVVTNRRILRIEQIVLFGRKISETSFQHIQDVSSNIKGVIDTLLDVGTVFVETAGERENFSFNLVSHPTSLATTILQLQREEWIEEGVQGDLTNQKLVLEEQKIMEMETKAIVAEEKEKQKRSGKESLPPQKTLQEKIIYNDGRVVIEDGVIWQSEQNITEEILSTLNDMEDLGKN